MISSAVCALTKLASRAAAARFAATANAAGSGGQAASWATRMVMSCRLGDSFMIVTVSVMYDISWVSSGQAR